MKNKKSQTVRGKKDDITQFYNYNTPPLKN